MWGSFSDSPGGLMTMGAEVLDLHLIAYTARHRRELPVTGGTYTA